MLLQTLDSRETSVYFFGGSCHGEFRKTNLGTYPDFIAIDFEDADGKQSKLMYVRTTLSGMHGRVYIPANWRQDASKA